MQFTMLEMLYLVIMIAIILIVIFLIPLLMEATRTMKSGRMIIDRAQDVVETLTEIPMTIAHKILAKLKGKKKREDED